MIDGRHRHASLFYSERRINEEEQQLFHATLEDEETWNQNLLWRVKK